MPNHLAQSPSLYLRKHAHNPIDWWPWSDDALTHAKTHNKPIFLSIGYSNCHWCTVMEGEAFSDEAIATYLNDHFTAIKVDREERPDLDSIYMQVLQMLTGHGGWPLNLFLAPTDLIPFYGGTYFPIAPATDAPASSTYSKLSSASTPAKNPNSPPSKLKFTPPSPGSATPNLPRTASPSTTPTYSSSASTTAPASSNPISRATASQ